MTRGAGGAIALARNCRVSDRPRAVAVADTIGAGDTFNAGLLAGLRERNVLSKDGLRDIAEDDLRHALVLANRVAAITVSRIGADPPWRHELIA